MASMSTRGEHGLLRRLMRRMAELLKTSSKVVDENTDLEKIKDLQLGTVPKVEKSVRELESTLQQYAKIFDPDKLDDLSNQVETANEKAMTFVERIACLYDEHVGYAPGLSGQEKAMTEIKPFAAGADVTVFEFPEKFAAYCYGTKKVKAYKLYNNYLLASIQAQTESFQQDYDAMIKFLKTTYGKIEVISGGLSAELEKRKKPNDNDYQKRAESLLAIANVILRIKNLKTKLPEEQVVAEITSYNFLHRIRNLLNTIHYMDLSKDLIENNLNARVAAGDKALELTLSRIRKTIAPAGAHGGEVEGEAQGQECQHDRTHG